MKVFLIAVGAALVAIAAVSLVIVSRAPQFEYGRYRDQVFKSQPRWQQGNIKPIFVEIAKANGLTEAQFEACLTDAKASSALQARLEYATGTDKVTGTPTFFVNGVMMPADHVPTLAELDAAIAKALKTGGRR